MNPYRVKITVRNNLLLSAIEAAGYASQREFADACDVGNSELSALVAMRAAPITKSGEFSLPAKKIMEALGAAPLDLWTDRQLTMELRRNTADCVFNDLQIQGLIESNEDRMTLPNPESALLQKEIAALVDKSLSTIRPRDREVLKKRFGLGDGIDMTLEEIGAGEDVTRNRIRQLEARGLRYLRHPFRSEKLEEFK